MENQEFTETNTEENLTPQLMITENMRSYLYDMAKWAKLIGIAGIFFSASMIIMALNMKSTLLKSPELASLPAVGPALSMMFIIYALVLLYPSILLLKYANKANEGVLYGNQDNLEEAISSLKSLFKFFGILAVIGIAFNFISIFSQLMK